MNKQMTLPIFNNELANVYGGKILRVDRSHRSVEEIVSINRPHIRPVVHDKAGRPAKFGAKVIGFMGGYS